MLAQVSGDNAQAQNASVTILQEALDGVKLYHDNQFQPYKRNMSVVAAQNGSRLLTAQNWQNDDKDCVILVPSLINTWHIFDIEEDHSFAAYLAGRNLQPLIVDWALPTMGDTPDMDDYIVRHLAPLLRHIVGQGYRIKAIAGYCMGATLLAALASSCPDIYDHINKTVLIAGPWGFDYQTPEQYMRLQGVGAQALAIANATNNIVPVDWVQSLFWAIEPLQVLRKFRKFKTADQTSLSTRRFVRVEDWLNDGREVTGRVVASCLHDWYQNDLPAKGQWVVDGAVVDPAHMTGDVLVAWGAKDNLVPPASAQKILTHLPRAKTVIVDTGHIGLMASDKGRENLWKPVAEFIISA